MRDFIFSNEKKYRIKRHIIFWIACYFFMVATAPPKITGSLNGISGDGFIRFYEMVSIRIFFHLACQMIFCYPLLYFLVPAYFWKKKYFKFICMFLLLWIVTSFFRYAAFAFAYNPIMQRLNLYVNPVPLVFIISFTQVIDGPAFIGFTFIALKFFKNWQQKQRDNFNLKKRKCKCRVTIIKSADTPAFFI